MRIYGHSMAPALNPGEVVLVDEVAYNMRSPLKGEVVAVRPNSLDDQRFVKRLVGLPCEEIKIGEKAWQLGEDEFFLLGDQPEHSMDSRIFGPVKRKDLIGPIRVRVWPWKVLKQVLPEEGQNG